LRQIDPAGAKARLILLALLARLKPCRCYRASRLSFSASCKARLILLALLARLKPCRCYRASRLSFSASCKAHLSDGLIGTTEQVAEKSE
jgi:hypothetical protein